MDSEKERGVKCGDGKRTDVNDTRIGSSLQISGGTNNFNHSRM